MLALGTWKSSVYAERRLVVMGQIGSTSFFYTDKSFNKSSSKSTSYFYVSTTDSFYMLVVEYLLCTIPTLVELALSQPTTYHLLAFLSVSYCSFLSSGFPSPFACPYPGEYLLSHPFDWMICILPQLTLGNYISNFLCRLKWSACIFLLSPPVLFSPSATPTLHSPCGSLPLLAHL